MGRAIDVPPHCDDLIGPRLSGLRESREVTQRRLANCVGVSNAYISRIESGDRVPSLQVLRAIAFELGVSESFLAWGIVTPRCPTCGGWLN